MREKKPNTAIGFFVPRLLLLFGVFLNYYFLKKKKIKVLFGLTFLALRVILKLKIKIRVFRRNDIIVW
jgi:hypothetical protein